VSTDVGRREERESRIESFGRVWVGSGKFGYA
jgi:hypothetical protein